jgi:uncharacterized protein with PIN domain
MSQEIKTAYLNFKTHLNDLIAKNSDLDEVKCMFKGRQSIKHLVESLRVPHTEVGKIRIHENFVDLNYIVQDGDHLEIWPVEHVSLDLIPRFIGDNHLGKLTKYLRILGFDTLYRNDFQDNELANISILDERVLLTRDRRLLMRRGVTLGCLIRSRIPQEQLIEVINRYNLLDEIKPFQRCLNCNASLVPVSKDTIIDRLQPLTRRYYHEFHHCPICDKIYWKGSHYDHMSTFLNLLMKV